MDVPIFNSRNSLYKSPFGAVPCGTDISFTLRPPLAEGFVSASLLLHLEFAGKHQELPLSPAGSAEDRALFTLTLTAPSDGL